LGTGSGAAHIYNQSQSINQSLARVADLLYRRLLRSASNSRLLIPSVSFSAVGSRAFTVTGPRVWNALPEETTSAQALTFTF